MSVEGFSDQFKDETTRETPETKQTLGKLTQVCAKTKVKPMSVIREEENTRARGKTKPYTQGAKAKK